MEACINVHTDGGARGNPGPSAIGVVINVYEIQKNVKNKKILTKQYGKFIGEGTNNYAEYEAIQSAFETIVSIQSENTFSISYINFYLDSQLVVNQLNGVFKVKNADLRSKLFTIRKFEQQCRVRIYYSYVPREKNIYADRLVNDALDRVIF